MKITYIKRLPQMHFGGEEITVEQEVGEWNQDSDTEIAVALSQMMAGVKQALSNRSSQAPVEQPEDSVRVNSTRS